MEKSVLHQLVAEVKETVATDMNDPRQGQETPSFGIVDLWNIRKHRRTAGGHFRGIRIPNGIGY